MGKKRTMSLQKLDRNELAAANINPETGLATDYLNHFNEVAMLIDMLSSMPDVAEDILEWRPITYAEHFLVTGFRAKELAIEAFQNCDPGVRERFEIACGKVEAGVAEIQSRLQGGAEALPDASERAADLYKRISEVGGVINPSGEAWNDQLWTEDNADDQAAVDALFD